MSDETNPGEQEPPADSTETPKVRRISNKLPRKTAKKAEPAPSEEAEVPNEEFDSDAPGNTDAGDQATAEQKRKNRRRRGKGKSQPDAAPKNDGELETIEESPPETSALEKTETQSGRQPQQNQRPPQKPRVRLDPEKVAKNAWKIFLAEVSEEGVALIGDNDARELARRCFRLSEIFMEEETRRN